MPCFETNLISVELKTADMNILHEALLALGLSFTTNRNGMVITTPAGRIDLRNGKAEFTNKGCQKYVNEIKQAYSRTTIEHIAKRYKFTLTDKGSNKIVLRRY